MKYVGLFFAIFVVSALASAGSVTFSKGGKSKDEYTNHKCVKGTFAASALKAKLTRAEICKYGKVGCSSIKTKEKLTSYCEHSTLSECFENRAWLSIDQIVGVTLESEPGLVTYGLNKHSENQNRTCLYWDSK